MISAQFLSVPVLFVVLAASYTISEVNNGQRSNYYHMWIPGRSRHELPENTPRTGFSRHLLIPPPHVYYYHHGDEDEPDTMQINKKNGYYSGLTNSHTNVFDSYKMAESGVNGGRKTANYQLPSSPSKQTLHAKFHRFEDEVHGCGRDISDDSSMFSEEDDDFYQGQEPGSYYGTERAQAYK